MVIHTEGIYFNNANQTLKGQNKKLMINHFLDDNNNNRTNGRVTILALIAMR